MAVHSNKCIKPQENDSSARRECIEVIKIFDQCVSEQMLSNCFRAADFCTTPIPAGSRITSEIIPESVRCFFVGFGGFNPPFFRPIRVLITLDLLIRVIGPDENLICEFTGNLQEIARAFLWAPEGTIVQCNVVNFGGGGCELAVDPLTGDQLICCRTKACAEIAIKGVVKLLIDSFGYCQAQPCAGGPIEGFPCPPQQVFPPQVCEETPTFILKDASGTGISNVTISLIRTVDGTDFTFDKVTTSLGKADFSEIGGFLGGIDKIQFIEPSTGKTVDFQIPAEFTDVNQEVHDSSTACEIVFQQESSGSRFFRVFIDGNELNTRIDP
jgi:hypothetical protein